MICEDLDTFNSPTQALRAWPKRKLIFCIIFHVIFVAFKSNINYSCDMRKGFSVLSGDTVCESAVGRVQKGPLSHSYCCYCGLVKLYSVFKETESISFHLIWLYPLFSCDVLYSQHVLSNWRNMLKWKNKAFLSTRCPDVRKDALSEADIWGFGSALYSLDVNPLY